MRQLKQCAVVQTTDGELLSSEMQEEGRAPGLVEVFFVRGRQGVRKTRFDTQQSNKGRRMSEKP